MGSPDDKMPSSTIVILGGGVGGVVTANELRKQLTLNHRVVLVEKNATHAFPPSFLWVMTGDRKPEQICRPLATLLRRGIELVQSEVLGINPGLRTVRTSSAEIAYDRLVVVCYARIPSSGLQPNATLLDPDRRVRATQLYISNVADFKGVPAG